LAGGSYPSILGYVYSNFIGRSFLDFQLAQGDILFHVVMATALCASGLQENVPAP
jgi:hypothetical protein